ncbi:class I adenylate-forming enzyme family protein [Chitinophaga nivalis]|uniref:Acyl--CoA ligase n=1 Tax=Chitinophaga nivalis TaxID=2991709 RepID=A0ABT3IMI2_9BACT|nr:class I adenylate-forming enzyme family protein [Chitinophaga nivalis]MCW3465318.1 acyl--CoA ligase [Chitinophaga nivalis]MCW3484990.1 acyl--CoA ligase [Chitinophaga nivalis]
MPTVFDANSLPALFRQQVDRFPDHPYITKEKTFTYQESDRIIRHIAAGLIAVNPERKMVALNIPCHQQLLFVFWACMLAGMDVLLLPDLHETALEQDLAAFPHIPLVITGKEDFLQPGAAGPGEEASLADVGPVAAVYFFSSGTTGKPKLICNTHYQLLAALRCLYNQRQLHYLQDCKTVYITPPLFHSYGLSAMLEYTMMGAAIILPRERALLGPVTTLFHPATAAVIEAIEGVPYFYRQLKSVVSRLKLPRLKHIGFGGDAVDTGLTGWLQEAFPEVRYSVRYGITEIPSVIAIQEFVTGEDINPAYLTSWLPVYQLSVQAEEEGTGDTGVLCVTTETDAGVVVTIPTGDVVSRRGTGFYLEGRSTVFFKYKGFRINPVRIETVLNTFDGIQASRVYLGENGKLQAACESAVALPVAALQAYLVQYLPAYMVPDEWLQVPVIKRTATGKIVRF